MNGSHWEFKANVSDIHISDEDLEIFNDNVNSAMCTCDTPGKKFSYIKSNASFIYRYEYLSRILF